MLCIQTYVSGNVAPTECFKSATTFGLCKEHARCIDLDNCFIYECFYKLMFERFRCRDVVWHILRYLPECCNLLDGICDTYLIEADVLPSHHTRKPYILYLLQAIWFELLPNFYQHSPFPAAKRMRTLFSKPITHQILQNLPAFLS